MEIFDTIPTARPYRSISTLFGVTLMSVGVPGILDAISVGDENLKLAREQQNLEVEYVAPKAGHRYLSRQRCGAPRNSDGNPLLRRRIWSVRPPRAK